MSLNMPLLSTMFLNMPLLFGVKEMACSNIKICVCGSEKQIYMHFWFIILWVTIWKVYGKKQRKNKYAMYKQCYGVH